MRRDCSHLLPLVSMLLLFPALSYGQAWSGILSSSRAIDWSKAGLPATFPDGETTPNPWTPPTRTTCTTAACNTVSGGNVTAATINAALTSAPAGTYVLIPAGTFALGGNISFSNNNVTLRGSGAASTKLTGGSINVGSGSWGGATLLTANPGKGATSITVASPPSAGRIASLEQCDDGWSASSAAFTNSGSGTVCTGAYSDPLGPWVCGQTTGICNQNSGGSINRHFQAHILWIPSVSGNTVNLASPIENANWSTARTASLTWLNVNGMVGAGIENLTLQGGIFFNDTYGCWIKGTRLISITASTSDQLITMRYDAHSLVANNYIASTQGGPGTGAHNGIELVLWGYDGGEAGQSDHLFINNIIDGGTTYGFGDQVNNVYAYNYYYTANNNTFLENGDSQHHTGTSFLLREGEIMGDSKDDATWGTHNFNTWFRNWITGIDPVYPSLSSDAWDIGSWARFENGIGNVAGNNPFTNTWGYGGAIITNAHGAGSGDTTGLTQASFMNWGNYVICSGDSRCNVASFLASGVPSNLSSFGANSTPYQNPVPANNNLPASFFMNNMTAHPSGGTGLSWWKACASWTSFPTSCASSSIPPMPPIGPEVTGGPYMNGHAYKIPARVAFESLPADTSYPTSWGYLRQFDERVYQNDAGGGTSSSPNAPTGLTAVVQ
jgi:hypothetical protein